MADFSNQTKLFFLSAIDNLRDPVRNTRWRMLIPNTIFAASGIDVSNGDQLNKDESGTDTFALHIKTAKIPDLVLEEASHYYMGFKSSYPINATIDGTVDFETILLEDMRGFEAMHGWQQSCLNTGVLVESDGQTDRMNQTGIRLGMGNHKDKENGTSAVLRNNTIKCELYNWMTSDVILQVYYINAYPTTVAGFNLDYASPALVNFSFSLHYDRWSVHIPKDYKSGL